MRFPIKKNFFVPSGGMRQEGDTIPESFANTFLEIDVRWAERAVNKLNDEFIAKHGYDPVERFGTNGFSALVSFTFNLGPGWSRKSGLRNLLMMAEWREAADRMLMYNKAGGKVLNGLVRRREAEMALFLKQSTS
jgi:lysozyme